VEDAVPFRCAAFPDLGIPTVILSGQNLHSELFPGQGNDIVFERAEGFGPEDAIEPNPDYP
jgi:hypothetical protein